MPRQQKTLVYACSGCSNVAQLANDVALRLDHQGDAQMSCIAGVGGKVPSLVRLAQSGPPVMAIDGCPLHCALSCLENVGVTPDDHVRLYDMGLKKRYGQTYDTSVLETTFEEVRFRVRQLDESPGGDGG